MKKFKKIAALLLAMVMALAMAVPAMAATSDTGSITVKGLTEGYKTNVYVYQIAKLNSTGNGWEVLEWASSVVTGVNDDGSYQYASTYANDESSALEALRTLANSQTANYYAEDVEGTSTTINGVAIGGYLVLASDEGVSTTYNPMTTCVLGYDDNGVVTGSAAEVTAKAGNGYTKKTETSDADHIYEVGQVLTYVIEARVPDKTNATSFTITDELTNATYAFDHEDENGTVDGWSVTIGGKTVDVAAPTATNGSFTLDLTSYIATNPGGKVLVTYKAIVGAADVVNNKAAASNDPTPNNEEQIVEGYTGEATITKYGEGVDATDGTTTRPVLEGAQFALFKYDADGTTKLYATFDSNGYVTGFGALTEGATPATLTTGANGTVTVKGLTAGVTYYFEEIVAPAGYTVDSDPVSVEVTLAAGKTVATSRGDLTMGNVKKNDTKLSSLPSTGGIGTTIFTVAGCMIMIAAGGMLIVSRRRKNA